MQFRAAWMPAPRNGALTWELVLTLRQPICGSIVFKRLDTSPRNCTRWAVKAWDCIAPVASRGSGEGKQGE